MRATTALHVAAGLLLNRGPRAVLGLLLVAAVVINVANVASRYVFGAPIVWAEEIMLYLMIAGVFIGAAPVTWDAQHLKMDLLTANAPRRLRRIIDMAALACAIGVCGLVASQSVKVAELMFRIDQRTPVLEWQVGWLHAAIAGGMLLTALAFAVRARLHVPDAAVITVEGTRIEIAAAADPPPKS